MSDTSTTGQNERVKTPIRTVRVDDELWTAATTKAKRRRESVADVIRRALLAYIEDEGEVYRSVREAALEVLEPDGGKR